MSCLAVQKAEIENSALSSFLDALLPGRCAMTICNQMLRDAKIVHEIQRRRVPSCCPQIVRDVWFTLQNRYRDPGQGQTVSTSQPNWASANDQNSVINFGHCAGIDWCGAGAKSPATRGTNPLLFKRYSQNISAYL